MTNTNFTKTAEGIVQERNDRYAKVFQPLTLITLVFSGRDIFIPYITEIATIFQAILF